MLGRRGMHSPDPRWRSGRYQRPPRSPLPWVLVGIAVTLVSVVAWIVLRARGISHAGQDREESGAEVVQPGNPVEPERLYAHLPYSLAGMELKSRREHYAVVGCARASTAQAFYRRPGEFDSAEVTITDYITEGLARTHEVVVAVGEPVGPQRV